MSGENELERRTQEWIDKGKRREEITYGMLCDGFQSLAGIPDDFYSAEDPADRIRLYADYLERQGHDESNEIFPDRMRD